MHLNPIIELGTKARHNWVALTTPSPFFQPSDQHPAPSATPPASLPTCYGCDSTATIEWAAAELLSGRVRQRDSLQL